MKPTLAALTLLSSVIFASTLVEMPNHAGLMDYAIASGATALFAGLTFVLLKD